MVLAYALYSIIPFFLLCLTLQRTSKGRTKWSLDGLALGLSWALWASVCWMAVPYCGGYPSLPGLAFSLGFRGLHPPIDTVEEEVAVYVGNVFFWTLLLWLSFMAIRGARKSRRLDEC
jgi:hypothetical protein